MRRPCRKYSGLRSHSQLHAMDRGPRSLPRPSDLDFRPGSYREPAQPHVRRKLGDLAADTDGKANRKSPVESALPRHLERRPEFAESDMRLRSLLFVPGDSERKFARARDCGADALILDLEDSVAASEKAAARAHVASLIEPEAKRDWTCIVRVNALDTGLTLDDLAAVVKPGLDALLIPKVNGAADLERIGHYLDALEAKAGMAAGSVKLASVATETPKAIFALGSYAPAHPRLF